MRRPEVALAVSAALLLGALFAGESVWTGLAALLVVGSWGALALLGVVPRPRGGLLPLALLLAIGVWSGLSIAWSVAPDRSWAELDRTLVYAAFLTLGLLFAAGMQRARLVLVVALGAAVVWALAGKAIPALFADGGRAARLRDPIGYWNALALAADVLLVLALSLAASARGLWLRAGAGVLAYAAVVAVLLAASRAGAAAALLGVAVWLWSERDRVAGALLALAATTPGVAVAAWAFTRPALVDDGRPEADRVADGALFGLLLLLGAALVALALRELVRRPLGDGTRARLARALRGLAIAGTVALAIALVLNSGRVADEFRGEEVGNAPNRFTSLSSNNRAAWWAEAADIVRADPVLGAGANTFEVARKRYRENASAVTQPHSVPLQFASGTGIVGLVLLLALVGAAAIAAAGALRRLDGDERAAAAALAVALALWLVHALVDYPWDFLAVTGPTLFALGVLAGAGRDFVFQRHKLASAGVAAFALAAAVSVATPWLAGRELHEVGRALERGDVEAAREAAESARSLDPLSLDPVLARARIEEQAGDERGALAAYGRAAGLQPENPESWLQLGLYEFSLGDRCNAYVHLNRAYTLDPAGVQWGEEPRRLDQAREWVNTPGNC
jgi:tetratricopeptide (TPR) repeat protein